jgi:hypothetical protein
MPPSSPQSRYQARRRAKARPITFFPSDGGKLAAAATIEGLTKQAWLAKTVDEAIEKKVAELVDQALRDFAPTCLWNADVTQPMAALLPLLVQALRKYGGMPGWRLAADIAALAGKERCSWH